MASLTIRNLDDAAKERLRMRAAQNGRSMEEEARLLLVGLDDIPKSIAVSAASAGTLHDKRILLIIAGGIAAYKAPDLIRRLRERGAHVRPLMTQAAQQFVTPLTIGAVSASHVYADLFSREDEQDVGHIRLARDADLIVVAPATADLMAKMAHGLADDLASAVLLARKVPVLLAPAMNPTMWDNPATKRNRLTLEKDGVRFIGPEKGEMAESGEAGTGRMSEPLAIVAAIEALLAPQARPLSGKTIVMTSGPTHEPIDPVRYIANRSSGKQGHAIASALASLGATVHLISGPVNLADPEGVNVIHVETAREMQAEVEKHLPADAAVMVAAVADWRTENAADQKIKKKPGEGAPVLSMIENPDILAGVGHSDKRPRLVVGFAAETQDVLANAGRKLEKKGADWVVANDVSGDVMGGDKNRVRILTHSGIEEWPEMSKTQVAAKLAEKIAASLLSDQALSRT